ncbi:armadillo-type protein [Elsinoe ampelina]|uniref:Armadillo-type protein n=1 Tax=Elsinoe ampelina TaxID=302913 RepID=A0A6A6GQ30_9PEZI|nr:armadillo-type protein [Elsinoe ampelina]
MDERHFVQLLENLLLPDTEKVKAATASLNKTYYTSPASVSALIHILVSNQNANLRQLAAVESRKLVAKHWAAVPDTEKAQLRQSLLQATLNEDQSLARHSKARVIAAIAAIDLADGQWSELPGILQQASTSQEARHREVGIYIIYTLLETMPDMFQENIGAMLALLQKTITDPDSVEVRMNSMLALSEITMILDTDEDEKSLKAFQSTIPHMVSILQQSIQAGDDEHTMQAFEIFNRLLSYESAFLNAHFGDLMQLMLDISSNTQVDEEARSQAISFLMQAVRYRKMKVQALRIGEQMTIKSMQIVTELDEGGIEDEDITPARSALGLLDIMAQSLPPSQVVVPLLKTLGQYVQHSNPDYRRAGVLALGMSVEGAPDFISTQLKEILPMVLHLLEDPEARVRSAALNGVARLADDLAEDMGKEHERILPALIKTFDIAATGLQNGQNAEENLGIVRSCCLAVDSLIEGLEPEDASKYVGELMPRFSPLMTHDDSKVQIASVGAVGSLASAVESSFMPFFEQTMRMLGPYVSIKDSEDELELRGFVCDSLGKIAGAVGAEPFQPFVVPLMQASEEALHLEHPRLRETSYILWSVLSKVYGDSFAPYLDGVIKGLIDCMKQDETEEEVKLGEEAKDLIGQEVIVAGKKIKVVSADDDDDDDDAIDIDDEDAWDDLGAVTAVAMEKEIAVEVVGEVLSNTGAKALPYLQKCLEEVFPLIEHNFEGVRKAAVGAIWRSYASLFALTEADGEGKAKWQPGLPLKVPVSGDVEKLGQLVMTATLSIWHNEVDRSTVTDINRNVAATLKTCGPAILNPSVGDKPSVQQITEVLTDLLTKKHPCQLDMDDEQDPDLAEESSEYDWLVIETAMEVITCLAAALGPDFHNLWQIFDKLVIKYCSGQDRQERTAAVGTVAECIGNMGKAVTPFTTKLMTILLKRLGDEDLETRSNAAYGTGLLCLHSENTKEILGNYNTILAKLEPLLHDQQGARLLDNSAGCVARMIRAHPDKVPLEEVLPVLVDLLPLREDYEENSAVFEMVVALYQAQQPVMMGLTGKLLPVLQKVLGPPEEQLDDETRGKVVQLAQYLQSQ